MENSVVANREAKPHGLISLHTNAKQPPWNDILAEKHRGAGGGSTKTLILLAANVYLLPRKGYLQDALFAGGKSSFAALKKSGRKLGRSPDMTLILLKRAALRGHPIGLLQFDAPEMGSRGDKFDAHALALLGIIAKIDHSAFLLLLRGGIGKNEQRSHFQVLLGVEQGAMGIDNDRFTGMLEPPALLILARELHPDSHEHSGAASFAFVDGCIHGTTMVGYARVCGQFLRWIRVPWGATALLDNVWTRETPQPGRFARSKTRRRGSRPPCTATAALLESERRFRRADGAE